MITVPLKFGSLNDDPTRSRRFVFRIITDVANPIYIRSHDDITIPPPGYVLDAQISDGRSSISRISQTLNLRESRASIGNVTFNAVDVNSSITDRLRSELFAGRGLNGKRVELYAGFGPADGFAWADFVLVATQIVNRATYDSLVYRFQCVDILRELRKNIFDPIELNLAAPLDATATTVEVYTTIGVNGEQLVGVEHGTSYTDGSAGTTVAYVKIDDEIIRVLDANIGATQLTNVQRGALGTRAAEHTSDDSAPQARGKKVTEVIYLELPVPKLVYGLLTGVLIQQSGTLPPHWNLGLAAADVRLPDFQNVGADWYVETDDTLGVIERYILDSREDGKRFIEREILGKYMMFLPIGADGQLGLRRIGSLLDGDAVVGEIDDALLQSRPTIEYAFPDIQNQIEIKWNEVGDDFTRSLTVIDTESVNRHGLQNKVTLEARGWVGNRHTERLVLSWLEAFRQVYTGAPIQTTAETLGGQLFEVGDIVRLRSQRARDATNPNTTEIDRAFLVIGDRQNVVTGNHAYQLLGATERPSPITQDNFTSPLPDAWYTSLGTDIGTLPGVINTGTEYQLPNGLALTGAATNDLAGAIYYATQDVRIPAGNVVTFTENIQLRVRGDIIHEGDMDGSGAGLPGVPDTVDVDPIPTWQDTEEPISFATQPGNVGYFGTTQADGGIIERVELRDGSNSRYQVAIQSLPATITQGAVQSIPSLYIREEGGVLVGAPTSLLGTSGGPGGVRFWNRDEGFPVPEVEEINRGGSGGNGGAGALVVCRGYSFGVAGRWITSGDDGFTPNTNLADERPAWSGGGAGGAPGAVIICLDGSNVTSPVLTNGNIIADNGLTPQPIGEANPLPSAWNTYRDTRFGDPAINKAFLPANRRSFHTSSTSGRQNGLAAIRWFLVLPEETPVEDVDDDDLATAQTFSLAVTESYNQRDDREVTLLIATITPISVTANFSHANIYAQRTTGPSPDPVPVFMCPADATCEFELLADGETYNIIARAVLINGVESPTDVVQVQIVTDSLQIPAPPDSLISRALTGGAKVSGTIPNGALGTPTEAEIWRASTTGGFGGAAQIATVRALYDQANDFFLFEYLDAELADGTYYYFARASNRHGVSTEFPAAGDGVDEDIVDLAGAQPPDPSTLFAFFPLDDSRIIDNRAIAASLPDGIITGTLALAMGPAGPAIALAPAGEQVQLLSTADSNTWHGGNTNTPFGVSIWFRSTSTTEAGILDMFEIGNGNMIALQVDQASPQGSQDIRLRYWNGSAFATMAAPTPFLVGNAWNHAVISRPSTNVLRFDLNGVTIDTVTDFVGGTAGDRGVYIGRATPGFVGEFALVRLYSAEITPSGSRGLFRNPGSFGLPPTLVAPNQNQWVFLQNFEVDLTPNNGVFSIVGLRLADHDSDPATPDVPWIDSQNDGFFILDGQRYVIDRTLGGNNFTGVATGILVGLVLYDTSAESFTVDSTPTRIATCYLLPSQGGNTWYYDNNGASVQFTPTANHVILGTFESDGTSITTLQPLMPTRMIARSSPQASPFPVGAAPYAGANAPDVGGLIDNSTFEQIDLAHVRPRSWWLSNSTNAAELSHGVEAGRIHAVLGAVGAENTVRLVSSAFQVNSNRPLRIRVYARVNVATATVAVRAHEWNGTDIAGQQWVSVGGSPNWDDQRDVVASNDAFVGNMALTTTWQFFTFDYTPPVAAGWVSFALDHVTATTSNVYVRSFVADPFHGDLAPLDQTTAAVTGANSVYQNAIQALAVGNPQLGVNAVDNVNVLDDAIRALEVLAGEISRIGTSLEGQVAIGTTATNINTLDLTIPDIEDETKVLVVVFGRLLMNTQQTIDNDGAVLSQSWGIDHSFRLGPSDPTDYGTVTDAVQLTPLAGAVSHWMGNAGARYRNADQNIALATTWTRVEFDVDDFDRLSSVFIEDLGQMTTGRYTAERRQRVRFSTHITMDVPVDQWFQIRIVNDAGITLEQSGTFWNTTRGIDDVGFTTRLGGTISVTTELEDNDWLEVDVQVSQAGMDVNGGIESARMDIDVVSREHVRVLDARPLLMNAFAFTGAQITAEDPISPYTVRWVMNRTGAAPNATIEYSSMMAFVGQR